MSAHSVGRGGYPIDTVYSSLLTIFISTTKPSMLRSKDIIARYNMVEDECSAHRGVTGYNLVINYFMDRIERLR
jgi:hypothetical protein